MAQLFGKCPKLLAYYCESLLKKSSSKSKEVELKQPLKLWLSSGHRGQIYVSKVLCEYLAKLIVH